MTDEDALMRAILDDPADTDVRLVYADWWDEAGRPPERSEFIRLQVAIAAIEADCGCGPASADAAAGSTTTALRGGQGAGGPGRTAAAGRRSSGGGSRN